MRLKALGIEYSEEAITERILKQRRPERIQPFHPAVNHARYKGSLKRRKSSVKGLRALYLHYVYLLRRTQQQTTRRTSFKLREDIRKMDQITTQTKLLCKHCIDTKEQLLEFINHCEKEKVALLGERLSIRNRKRRTADENALEWYMVRSKEITCMLSTIRGEMKAADDVLSRLNGIGEN